MRSPLTFGLVQLEDSERSHPYNNLLTISVAAQLTLNTSFSAGITDGNSNGFVSAVQADGKILVGGNFALVNGVEQFGLAATEFEWLERCDLQCWRTQDRTAGVFEIKIIARWKDPDQRQLHDIQRNEYLRIARLNSDGTLDGTFNTGGTGTTGAIRSIAIQPDGKYLVSGQNLSAYNGTARFSIIRINADGTLDATFTSPFAAPAPFVEQPALQSDGKIIIGGTFTVGAYNNLAASRRVGLSTRRSTVAVRV